MPSKLKILPKFDMKAKKIPLYEFLFFNIYNTIYLSKITQAGVLCSPNISMIENDTDFIQFN